MMNTINDASANLIAPCGMNCSLCSRYLAYLNNLNRPQCQGCRPENKTCTYLFGKCTGMNSCTKGTEKALFCDECGQYPCKGINRLDSRYRKSYGMSMKENLAGIESLGMEKFLEKQRKRYGCPTCNGLISVHNQKCFKCDTITW